MCSNVAGKQIIPFIFILILANTTFAIEDSSNSDKSGDKSHSGGLVNNNNNNNENNNNNNNSNKNIESSHEQSKETKVVHVEPKENPVKNQEPTDAKSDSAKVPEQDKGPKTPTETKDSKSDADSKKEKPVLEPTQFPGGHKTSLDADALKRGFYVFVALSLIVLAYIAFRSFSKTRAQMIRKYGILAHRQDVEMRPLPLEEDDDEDTTVFDASNVSSAHEHQTQQQHL